MSLSMSGHIDFVFKSLPATRTSVTEGSYVNGLYVPGNSTESQHTVNIQPLNQKEVDFLSIGADRITDTRKIFVNDGDLYSVKPTDTWTFDGIDGVFRCISIDNRPWRHYCKLYVSLEGSS